MERGLDRRYYPIFIIVGAAALAFSYGFFSDFISLKFLVAVVLAVLAGNVIRLPYKWAVWFLFFYLGVEGMLKMLSNYNPIIHVGSDILVFVLCARWFLSLLLNRASIPKDLPPFLPIFALHFTWFLIEFANPYALGLVPSLAGAKIYVTMFMLYFFGYYLTESVKDAGFYMIPWIFTAFVQTVTGLYQAHVGPSSVLSLAPGYAAALRKFEGYAFRPFGTTNLAGGPAEFIFLASPFLIYFIIKGRVKIVRFFLVALLPAALMTVIVCQVRSALMKQIVGVAGFIFLLTLKSRGETRKQLLIVVPAVAVILAFVLPMVTSQWAAQNAEGAAAIGRTMTLFDYKQISRAREGAGDRITSFAQEVPLGAGLSRTGASAGKFADLIANDPFYPGGFFSDNFWAATIAEVGIPGSIILTALLVAMILRGLDGIRRTQDLDYIAAQAVLTSCLIMVMSGLWGAEGVLYNPEAAYYWFFSGVLMKLVKLGPAQQLKL